MRARAARVPWYFRLKRAAATSQLPLQLAGDVATMLAYLALGIPPAGHVRRLDTQTITVTGGSFSSPYYTFDGGGCPEHGFDLSRCGDEDENDGHTGQHGVLRCGGGIVTVTADHCAPGCPPSYPGDGACDCSHIGH